MIPKRILSPLLQVEFIKSILLLASLLIFSSPSLAKSGGPSIEGLGLFGMPILGFQNGTYKFDNELDKGVLNIGYGGAKAGLNLGFIYLGVEYLESLPRASSDKRINPQDKVIYPVLDGNLTSIGPTLGIELGRVLISGSYFVIETAKKKGLEYGFEKFDHTYHGTGVKVGVGYRLWKNAFFELNAHKRTYDKFSSKYSGNFGDESSLTSKLSATTFGFSFFYIAKAEDLVQFK